MYPLVFLFMKLDHLCFQSSIVFVSHLNRGHVLKL